MSSELEPKKEMAEAVKPVDKPEVFDVPVVTVKPKSFNVVWYDDVEGKLKAYTYGSEKALKEAIAGSESFNGIPDDNIVCVVGGTLCNIRRKQVVQVSIEP